MLKISSYATHRDYPAGIEEAYQEWALVTGRDRFAFASERGLVYRPAMATWGGDPWEQPPEPDVYRPGIEIYGLDPRDPAVNPILPEYQYPATQIYTGNLSLAGALIDSRPGQTPDISIQQGLPAAYQPSPGASTPAIVSPGHSIHPEYLAAVAALQARGGIIATPAQASTASTIPVGILLAGALLLILVWQ